MVNHEADQALSLSLSAKNWARSKEQSPYGSALFSASCQRSESLSSVAPILRTSVKSVSLSSLTPQKGDISTLSNRGHFYLGLTGLFNYYRKV